jgi:hypothetical protein
MVNALVGKLEGDGSVAFIYCHERGGMSELGQVLLENFKEPQDVDTLLQQGHCKFPGVVEPEKWQIMGQVYRGGETFKKVDNKRDFLEKAVEEVQAVYLYAKNTWRYANALSNTPSFVAVRSKPGEDLNRNKSKRPFYTRVW